MLSLLIRGVSRIRCDSLIQCKARILYSSILNPKIVVNLDHTPQTNDMIKKDEKEKRDGGDIVDIVNPLHPLNPLHQHRQYYLTMDNDDDDDD